MAVVCDNYPESQISKESFSDTQRAIGRLVDELPEERFTPGWLSPIRLKGLLLCSATTN